MEWSYITFPIPLVGVERSRSPHPENLRRVSLALGHVEVIRVAIVVRVQKQAVVRSFCCVVAKREPDVFRCQFDAVMVEVEFHDYGEMEVTGVELATFRDSCRGPGIGVPQFDTTGSAAVERRLYS